ncbi:Zinc-type alcohol dehydrogenase C1773.06c-like protein 3 [Colletotrichum chlorophyti]|uniref:Zinc-type alcohol dehydrogenase C1773.06c-like protein 3 n=1 Tax=Colletotrichum chlorophyti TaxID=708187 RepID=A0A1Q8RZN2_9PEZI|nr:Zinc-type alcohol dehydrogenase C1773.06c-like protein 3 [Colletotrichum chlorophyti]
MSLPKTFKAYRRSAGPGPLSVVESTESLRSDLGPHEVLIKTHAVSLNFRDFMQLGGDYPFNRMDEGILASDAAGEVIATGSSVKDFKIGDHVSPSFFTNRFTDEDLEPPSALGGDVHGVLSQYGIFEERALVHLPPHLSWEEGATIACAGVTAWNAIGQMKGLSEKSTVLLEGTGGVSSFALHVLVAAGVKVIITSSSDKKIASIKKLSPLIEGINYKTHEDIAAEVKRITNGRGVDLVVNNTGVSSVSSNIDAIAEKGSVSLVGFLGGFGESLKEGALLNLMSKQGTIRGVAVGSTSDFRKLSSFLDEKKVNLKGLIDRVFAFEDAPSAVEYLGTGQHVGKIVIKVY